MKRRWKPKGYVEPTGVSAKEFVRTWQTASTVTEVAKTLNRTRNAVRVRAFRFRARGVPLKEFPPEEIELTDWEALAEYAESLETSPEGSEPAD